MRIYAIFKKEFSLYFSSPLAYILAFSFLMVSGYLFIKPFFLLNFAGMRQFFEILPWIYLFFLPAITMRLWSEEKKQGTIELLFTLPLSNYEIVLGKFLASLAFLLLLLFLTFPIPLVIAFLGFPDPGTILGGYAGSILLGASFLSIGLFCSSLSSNQIISFILTVFACFLLLIIGEEFVAIGAPQILVGLFRFLSMGSHFNSIARGVLDSRDIIYYFSLIYLFLILNIRRCELTRRRSEAFLLIIITFGIILAINCLSLFWFQRIDLTDAKLYSLSSSTKKILKNLDEPLNINCYFSKALPPDISGIKRDVRDILDEYKIASPKKLRYSFCDPDVEGEENMRLLGIPRVSVSVIEKDKLSSQNLFLGIVIYYQNKKEIIPVIKDTGSLEYELTSKVLKLLSEQPTFVGFLTDDEKILANFRQIGYLLSKDYPLSIVSTSTLNNVDTIIATGIGESSAEGLKGFVEGGKGLFLLVDKMKVADNGLAAEPQEIGIERLLAEWGAQIETGLVLDPSCANASFQSGQNLFSLPYPFFPKVSEEGLNKAHPIVRGIESLVLPYSSAIKLSGKGISLISSSPSSWIEKGMVSLSPQQPLSMEEKRSHNLATVLTPGKGKVVLVAGSWFAKDNFLFYTKDNANLFLNAVEWLSNSSDLIEIRSKGKTERPLKPISEGKKGVVKGIVIFGMPILISIFSIGRSLKKRYAKGQD
ncbi:MAG: Gldg family protein [bacterium]|nr:Gldg family protein [bacterium]